uniref:Conotoxin-like unassigned superfamily 05 n=1 Tax=Conus ermineus TaxID=55423 RepID=A0A346CJ27_CONER|nr:conotoxin-like precursor unassigned superfamily 05 [Conus ermineus]
MNFSVMFILALVLTLSMTDAFILPAENGGRTFRQHSSDSMDLKTRQIETRNLCPQCPKGCHVNKSCIE